MGVPEWSITGHRRCACNPQEGASSEEEQFNKKKREDLYKVLETHFREGNQSPHHNINYTAHFNKGQIRQIRTQK